MMSIEQIKRFLELYPIFFDLYEESKIKELRKLLRINNASQQKIILKKLMKEKNLGNPIPVGNLARLEMIYSLRLSKKLSRLAKKTGKNKWTFPPNKLDNLIMHTGLDHLFLHREPEFFNEIILVYLTTIFKEYLKSILKKVFTLYPQLTKKTKTKIRIDEIPDQTDKIFKIFKNNLEFDLEKHISKWNLIEEKFLRRNSLIHNNGFPDDVYKEKTRYIGNSRLKTDTNYVKESLKTFEKSETIIQNYLWKKYGNPKFLEQMNSEDILD